MRAVNSATWLAVPSVRLSARNVDSGVPLVANSPPPLVTRESYVHGYGLREVGCSRRASKRSKRKGSSRGSGPLRMSRAARHADGRPSTSQRSAERTGPAHARGTGTLQLEMQVMSADHVWFGPVGLKPRSTKSAATLTLAFALRAPSGVDYRAHGINSPAMAGARALVVGPHAGTWLLQAGRLLLICAVWVCQAPPEKFLEVAGWSRPPRLCLSASVGGLSPGGLSSARRCDDARCDCDGRSAGRQPRLNRKSSDSRVALVQLNASAWRTACRSTGAGTRHRSNAR